MLSSLEIANVVLIDRLRLTAEGGLLALTGETGAGKSILLDALGLALGARADAGMVRHGSDMASVTATFDLSPKHAAYSVLQARDIAVDAGEPLVIRRTVTPDGRSKAYIADQPVSVQLLKSVGETLVEIHGQFDTHGLMDPATHIATLDAYAGLEKDVAAVNAAWAAWQEKSAALVRARADIEKLKQQEDYLRHVVAELDDLAPEAGEEQVLSDKRLRLKQTEKWKKACDDATDVIEGEDGIRLLFGRLESAVRRLETTPAATGAETPESAIIAQITDAVARARIEIDEAAWQIEKLSGSTGSDDNLEDVEERYFALRDAAKKHRCSVDDLPQLHADMAGKLKLITDQDRALDTLETDVDRARTAYADRARVLTSARQKAALKMAKAINAELPDLKLDRAVFSVAVTTAADENGWGANGFETVQFMVTTNPGQPAGPLHKIASGGELSRLMLALKVSLAETGAVPTLIFDEVDSGIGGATADAVGERLQRLAKNYQVLVVTHSPQVAARAHHHWHVEKKTTKGTTVTSITPLQTAASRAEEIARMLSGAEITAEARAQALKLLKTAPHAA